MGLKSNYICELEDPWLKPRAIKNYIIERTGAANENPFKNLVTDVPLTSICNKIERDLLEMLGSENLPPKLKAEKWIFILIENLLNREY